MDSNTTGCRRATHKYIVGDEEKLVAHITELFVNHLNKENNSCSMRKLAEKFAPEKIMDEWRCYLDSLVENKEKY